MASDTAPGGSPRSESDRGDPGCLEAHGQTSSHLSWVCVCGCVDDLDHSMMFGSVFFFFFGRGGGGGGGVAPLNILKFDSLSPNHPKPRKETTWPSGSSVEGMRSHTNFLTPIANRSAQLWGLAWLRSLKPKEATSKGEESGNSCRCRQRQTWAYLLGCFVGHEASDLGSGAGTSWLTKSKRRLIAWKTVFGRVGFCSPL